MTSFMIEFIENFFERSCSEIIDSAADRPESLTAKKAAFLELLASQVGNIAVGTVRSLSPGELRPIVGSSISDLAKGGINLGPTIPRSSFREDSAESFSLDVRSLLLYAHSVALPNPFGLAVTVGGFVGKPRVRLDRLMSDSHFIFGLELLSRLDRLITEGVVILVETEPKLDRSVVSRVDGALASIIPEVAMELVNSRIFNWSDQNDLYMRAQELAERFLRQDLLLNSLSGDRATRLISCEAERVALPAFASMRSRWSGDTQERDPWVLDELVRLQLQGAGRLKLSDVVAVRDDESFSVFRKDMAEAVAASAEQHVGDALYNRQVVVADEMRAAAQRLNLSTRKSMFISSTLGDAISWAVGSAVGGALAGWSGVLAGLAAKGVTEVIRSGPSRARRALRTHYVELSKPPVRKDAKPARYRLLGEG